MDRIEPVRRSPPAIAPAEAARVRRPAREDGASDPQAEQRRRRRERQQSSSEAPGTKSLAPDDGEDEARPRIDIRA